VAAATAVAVTGPVAAVATAAGFGLAIFKMESG
jgi:hypothetical protein